MKKILSVFLFVMVLSVSAEVFSLWPFSGHDELPIASFLENSFLFLVWLLVKETLHLGGKVYMIMEKQQKFYLGLNF